MRGREVEQEIFSKNGQWCVIRPVEVMDQAVPVRYGPDSWLEADAELGYWACLHVRNHIHFMDQNVCHVYNLPRERWQPRPVSRQIASVFDSGKPGGVAPGQSIANKTRKPLPKPCSQLPKHSFPKAHGEDIAYSKVWRQWQEIMLERISLYTRELGLQEIGQAGHFVGSILPNTLSGQERHWECRLLPPDPHERRNPEVVNIRFRETNLIPFMTIWGTNSKLEDFPAGKQDAAIEYLKDCIDKTLTMNS